MSNKFKYALDGRSFVVPVVDVYDGDTCTVKFNPWPEDPDSQEWEFKIRLLGYNSEEIHQPRNLENRAELKDKATEDKEALIDLIGGKTVTIKCWKFDNFGRILAHVYVVHGGGEICVNEKMLNDGHGVEYLRI
jgi:endonuclease YncB( thermonuclease family)